MFGRGTCICVHNLYTSVVQLALCPHIVMLLFVHMQHMPSTGTTHSDGKPFD